LFGDQVADGPRRFDRTRRPSPLRGHGRGDDTFGDEAIDRSWLVQWYQSCDCFAVVGDGHLLAAADEFEVAAEMISQVTHSGFHSTIMALSMMRF
jgi:hypothetical protein